MKKALLLALGLIIILCTACTSLDSETEEAIKDDVYSIYETLRSDWAKAKNVREMEKSITKWAQDNEISCAKLSSDNLLLSEDATDDYKKAPSTLIQCDLSTDHYSSKAQCAAIAMAALNNSQQHGSLRILFTASDKTGYYGTEGLSKSQLKADNLISLTYCKKNRLFTGSAASKEYLLSQKIKHVKTSGTISYKAYIGGLEGGDSSDMTRKHGNPIKALGQFMNSCQSSGLAFQVNDFKGGSSSGTYPSFAQMTITVDKNDEKKLLETFDTIRKNFEDSYRDNENSLKISCTKCKTPNTSYSEEDTANIMSFLYTVKDGTFATENDDEDGEAVAVANIGFASEKGKNGFVLGMKGRSINPGIFKKMLRAYKDTADLSDFTIKEKGSFPCWPFRDKSELNDSFKVAARQADLDLEEQWTFEENECALFYEKRQDLDMICIGANIQSGQEIAQSLVMYLSSLADE